MNSRMYIGAITGALIGFCGASPVNAAQLYDMNRFLNQSHPFANPAPAPVTRQAPVMRQASGTTTRVQSRPAPPRMKSTAPKMQATSTKSGFFDGTYATVNIQGGYSIIGDARTTNITDLIERRGKDWVGGNSISVGYDWKKSGVPIRSELEAFVRYRFDLDYRGTAGGNLQGYANEVASFGAMVNGFYDFDYSWKKIRPYVGAGVGLARHWSQSVRSELDTVGDIKASQDTRTNNLTWAFMLGFNYEWSKNWAFRMEGRYQDFGEVVSGPFDTDNDTITGDYTTLDLMLGGMYHF